MSVQYPRPEMLRFDQRDNRIFILYAVAGKVWMILTKGLNKMIYDNSKNSFFLRKNRPEGRGWTSFAGDSKKGASVLQW
jgi:hypothetical protein